MTWMAWMRYGWVAPRSQALRPVAAEDARAEMGRPTHAPSVLARDVPWVSQSGETQNVRDRPLGGGVRRSRTASFRAPSRYRSRPRREAPLPGRLRYLDGGALRRLRSE